MEAQSNLFFHHFQALFKVSIHEYPLNFFLKFEAPIVSAWQLKDKQIQAIDLFDSRVVPALDEDQLEKDELNRPFLYLGEYWSPFVCSHQFAS